MWIEHVIVMVWWLDNNSQKIQSTTTNIKTFCFYFFSSSFSWHRISIVECNLSWCSRWIVCGASQATTTCNLFWQKNFCAVERVGFNVGVCADKYNIVRLAFFCCRPRKMDSFFGNIVRAKFNSREHQIKQSLIDTLSDNVKEIQYELKEGANDEMCGTYTFFCHFSQ